MRILKSGFAVLALLMAIMGATTGQATAQEEASPPPLPGPAGTIEVHARMCEEVPADWYAECHESPAPDTYIAAMNTDTQDVVEGTTDASGNILLEVAPGTWQVTGPTGDSLEDWFVYCSNSDSPADDIGHPVRVEGGAYVICDFFFVPGDQSGLMDVSVQTNLCVAAGCTEQEDAIEPADGVGVALSDVDTGEDVGACTSEAGECVVEGVPETDVVSVMVDPETIPEGYMLEPNPANYELSVDNPEVLILLLPTDGFPPDDGAPPPTEPGDDPAPPYALELPSSLYAASCADLDAAQSAEPLGDVTMVEGEPGGSPDALTAASGYTELPMTVGEFLDGEYAIAVFDEGQQVIACGDVGGVLDETGAVAIGMGEVDDSGAAGTAYLAPRGDDGQSTGITLFLVPDGLIPDVDTESTPDAGIIPEGTPTPTAIG